MPRETNKKSTLKIWKGVLFPSRSQPTSFSFISLGFSSRLCFPWSNQTNMKKTFTFTNKHAKSYYIARKRIEKSFSDSHLQICTYAKCLHHLTFKFNTLTFRNNCINQENSTLSECYQIHLDSLQKKKKERRKKGKK